MINKLLKFPFHTILFAFYPVLFFYSQNYNTAFVSQTYPSLKIALGVFTISYLLFLIVYFNAFQASFVTTLALLLFYSHGHIKTKIGAINYVLGSITIGEDKILVVTWGIVLLLSIVFAFRYRKLIYTLTPALNLFITTVLLLTGANILFGIYKGDVTVNNQANNERQAITNGTTITPDNVKTTPDIYYIILDKYAANQTLSTYYGYDNSDFTNFLKKKGFYVAEDSKTNYPRTSYSLATSLNMEYLPTLANEMEVDVIAENPELKVVFPRLLDHQVWKLLHQVGYTYYHIGSWFQPTRTNPNATESFALNSSRIQLDEFTTRFLHTTLIVPFADKYLPLDFDTQHRLNILYEFDKLSTLISKPGPKFVFAHILVPHGPYVLESNCQIPSLDWNEKDNIYKYVSQIQCGNKRAKEVISLILDHAGASSIIVLQSDEGPNSHVFTMTQGDYSFEGVETGAIIERTRIQNAFYFPDQNYTSLYSTISPVNNFRVIFNKYFGLDLPVYEDKTFITMTEDDLYNFAFTEVEKSTYTQIGNQKVHKS